MYYYALTVAYEGTHYAGFQVQNNAVTIQEKLMEAGRSLFDDSITMTGASRTDSGVHARGQVVLFTTPKWIEPRKIPMALGQRLPNDIVITEAVEVDEQWHPRYQSHRKIYRYHVHTDRVLLPWQRPYVYQFFKKLDLKAIEEAAKIFVGTHDFNGYSSCKKSVEDTVRTIYRLEIQPNETGFVVEIEGNGFLYNMVRIIVGTLLKVGTHQISCQQIETSLSTGERSMAGPTAPAKGLFLHKIMYDQSLER